MATTSCSSFVSSESIISNYARLRLATQKVLPNILRELLLIKEPPHLLEAHIDTSYLSNNLKPREWNIIKAVRKNLYGEFDVPLIYKIIKTLNLVPYPTKGWGNQTPPAETEITVGDDIERIRRIRNEIVHRGNANISDTELTYYFSIFKNIARRLELYLKMTNREFELKIENVETCVIYNEKEHPYFKEQDELTMLKKLEINNIEFRRDRQRFRMPDDGIHFQEQIHHGEQEGILSKNNQENLLICDGCNFGIGSSYCTICKQYFCKRCYRKMHVLTPHNQVLLQGLDPKRTEVRCNQHELYLDLFCFDDDKPICKKCVEDHKNCKFSKIEHAVKEIDLNNRQSKLYSSFQDFLSEIDETKETICCDLDSIDEKQHIFLNKTENIEQKISNKISRIKVLALRDIRSHEKKMETIITEIDERKGRAMELEEEFRRLVGISSKAERLVNIHKLEQLLKTNHKNFLKMLKRVSIATIDQKFRVDLNELHDAIIDLGLNPIRRQIFLNKLNIKLTKILSFKLQETTNISFIRGCAILPNDTICFTDDNEGLFVRYSSGMVKAFELPCSPVDITYIGENRIAISLRKRRSVGIITLNQIETEDTKSEEYMFKDIGSISSLTYDGKHIIIQIGSFGFYIVDQSGNIIEKVSINGEINIQYVSCKDDKIYYTKWDTNTIICCDRKGKVLWDFHDGKILKSPIGIAVDENGNVFATGLYSNNVVAISPCGKYCVEILSHSSNVNLPHVIDYCSNRQQLLVCSSSGDAVLYSVDTSKVVE